MIFLFALYFRFIQLLCVRMKRLQFCEQVIVIKQGEIVKESIISEEQVAKRNSPFQKKKIGKRCFIFYIICKTKPDESLGKKLNTKI